MAADSKIKNRLLELCVFGFFLFPFLFLFSKFQIFNFSIGEQFVWALQNTVVQAALSAVLSLIVALFLALGLLHFLPGSSTRKILENICAAPNYLPTLFSLVFVLSFVEPFPFGVLGIVLVHAFISAGFVAVALVHELETQHSRPTQLAYIEGAGTMQILNALRRPIWHLLRRNFFSLFLVFFASFTVPLVVGGGRGTTIEVLIYEKIRIDADWSSALTLSFFQTLLLLGLSFLVRPSSQSLNTTPSDKLYGLRTQFFGRVLQVLVILFVSYCLLELYRGVGAFLAVPGLLERVLEVTPYSLLIAILTLVFASVIFSVQLFLFESSFLDKFLVGFSGASTALTALTYLFAAGEGSTVGLALAMLTVFYLICWRLWGASHLRALQNQFEVALSLGASRLEIARFILWPQMRASFAQIAQVLLLWSLGDFAVTRVILGQEKSLGVLAQNLASSYRLEASFVVTAWILTLGWSLGFLVKYVVKNVVDFRSRQKI